MSGEVAIVDYGAGNLLSVEHAVRHVGGTPAFVQTAPEIARAETLILPGVGAFGAAMAELRRLGLVEPLRQAVQQGRPMLGICLGMQMLFERSHEFGTHEGLGLVPGEVVPVPTERADGEKRRIPVIGWFRPVDWSSDRRGYYFVNSFMADPEHPGDVVEVVEYEGVQICASVERENVMGCQYHPEKSAKDGLAVLERFLERKSLRES